MNRQPVEALNNSDLLEVHSIWRTIQGEGPYAGTPAIFIRLAGCNLRCPLCDTDYTSNRETLTAEGIVDLVNAVPMAKITKLVVITGGEPFRQHIGPLVRGLYDGGRAVQVESNGICHPGDKFPFGRCLVVVSPKTSIINPALVPYVAAWKYVLSDEKVDPHDGLPTSALGMSGIPARPPAHVDRSTIYVQPLDEQHEKKNQRHLKAAADSCLMYGYRLCVQMHKLARLP